MQIETHCHTSPVSPCAHVSVADTLAGYAGRGYGALILTEHYYDKLWDSPQRAGKAWPENAAYYLASYREARKIAPELGIRVLLGMEIRFAGDRREYLVYGPDEAFIEGHPYLNRMEPEAFREMADAEGFLLFQAHPYRFGLGPLPGVAHGIEVFNGHRGHVSHNRRALEYAAAHGLPMLSGSDFHEAPGMARGGVIMDGIETIEDFIAYYRTRGTPELILSCDYGKEGENK